MENLMVFEDSQLFGYVFSRHDFPWMDHKNEPDLSTRSADLGKALGRSRVENPVAWENPGDAVSKCVICHPFGPHKHPQKWMVLASKMVAPNTMTLQNHKENRMVFEDSHFFDH